MNLSSVFAEKINEFRQALVLKDYLNEHVLQHILVFAQNETFIMEYSI